MEEQLRQILELCTQPIFLAKDDVVVWRNSAASALLAEGAPLAALLARANPLFSRWTRDGVLQIPLTLQNTDYDATVLSVPEGDLFAVTRSGAEDENSSNAVLSASVSLRRTLHTMLSAADDLFGQVEENPAATPAASQLNQSIYQLLRLSNQMTEIGQLLLHRMSAHRAPMEFKAFLEEFIFQARPLVEAAGLTLCYTSLPVPTHGDADAALLERALYQLLSNAIRYTPRGGTITLTTERQGRSLLFSVSDTGEGIPKEVLSSLFSRFSSQPLGDSRWGAGLGLPIVREIARLHGGSIMVNALEERGTCVTFSVSLEPTVLALRSPVFQYDFYSATHHGLVELSDVLPPELFNPAEV